MQGNEEFPRKSVNKSLFFWFYLSEPLSCDCAKTSAILYNVVVVVESKVV